MFREPVVKDVSHQRREELIQKARQNLGINRRGSSQRRALNMPVDRDMRTPIVASTVNPLGQNAQVSSTLRQKTTLNKDLQAELVSEAKTAGAHKINAAKAPLAVKRGNSLGPGRLKTSSVADVSAGLLKSSSLTGGGRETPIGTAGESTAFSKRSNATGMPKVVETNAIDLERPHTEFIPSASQEFGDRLKQGRLRPTRQTSKSGQN